jgi:hypothetical protein
MSLNSDVPSMLLDRAATPEEIRAAMSLSSESAAERGVANVWEIASDFGGSVRASALEVETLRLIEELLGDS